jgi:hypothetical protein
MITGGLLFSVPGGAYGIRKRLEAGFQDRGVIFQKVVSFFIVFVDIGEF